MEKVNNECEDIELLYRLCAMEKFVEYNGKNFKISNYNNSIKELIDDFAETAFYFNKSEIEKYRNKMENFIELLGISKTYFQRKSLLEGLFVVYEKTDIQKRKLTDELCKESWTIKKSSTRKMVEQYTLTNMNIRWKRIYEILSDY